MVKYRLISIFISLIICCSITADLIKTSNIENDTIYMMEYLESIYPIEELEQLSGTILLESKFRKSFERYGESVKSAQSSMNYKDSLLWPQLIDREDIDRFTQEMVKIPKPSKYDKLNKIRNKIIYSNYINYLSWKIGAGSQANVLYFNEVLLDMENNLTVTNNYKNKRYKIISINNQYNIQETINDIIRIPIADTLDIVVKVYSSESDYLPQYSDSLLQRHIMDISNIEDGEI